MAKIRSTFKEKAQVLSNALNLEFTLVSKLCESYQSKLNRVLQEENLCNYTESLRDKRTTKEYLYDLFDGWLVEDLLTFKLGQELKQIDKDYRLLLQGCEMGLEGRNVFFSSKMISSKSDLEIALRNKKIKIELQFANQDRQSYDIKETKMRQLRKEQAFILIYSLDKKQGFILDTQKDRNLGKMQPNPRWGGKMSFNFSKETISRHIGFEDLKGLANKINKILGE